MTIDVLCKLYREQSDMVRHYSTMVFRLRSAAITALASGGGGAVLGMLSASDQSAGDPYRLVVAALGAVGGGLGLVERGYLKRFNAAMVGLQSVRGELCQRAYVSGETFDSQELSRPTKAATYLLRGLSVGLVAWAALWP